MHSTTLGIACSRFAAIGFPHSSHSPYVPSSSLASARSVRCRPTSNDVPTPISVSRLIASTVPSPIRLPKPCAVPRSGRFGEGRDALAALVAVRLEVAPDRIKVGHVPDTLERTGQRAPAKQRPSASTTALLAVSEGASEHPRHEMEAHTRGGGNGARRCRWQECPALRPATRQNRPIIERSPPHLPESLAKVSGGVQSMRGSNSVQHHVRACPAIRVAALRRRGPRFTREVVELDTRAGAPAVCRHRTSAFAVGSAELAALGLELLELRARR